jgi:hypothetical protein
MRRLDPKKSPDDRGIAVTVLRPTSERTASVQDKYPQQSEQSVPEKAPASDQARSHRYELLKRSTA